MSKYDEIRRAFADSVARQRQHIDTCCEFVNFTFDKMASYFEWPRAYIFFMQDLNAQQGDNRCHSGVVSLNNDGYIHFVIEFTIQRYDDQDRLYNLDFLAKVKKVEDNFLINIAETEEEFMFDKSETEEQKRFFEYVFHLLKKYFDTPFLEFTDRDLLRLTDGDGEIS